ncbi:MAG: hypothetical protein HC872_04215 [Gammaproteobacteria bacterium]|nr:hypothetical protein [Gammaproteobacteria bacterium]
MAGALSKQKTPQRREILVEGSIVVASPHAKEGRAAMIITPRRSGVVAAFVAARSLHDDFEHVGTHKIL